MASCSFHCGGCNRHFRSLEAFDIHRVGSHTDGSRHCESPLDLKGKLVAIAEDDGICRISGGPMLTKETIWATGRRVGTWMDAKGRKIDPDGG